MKGRFFGGGLVWAKKREVRENGSDKKRYFVCSEIFEQNYVWAIDEAVRMYEWQLFLAFCFTLFFVDRLFLIDCFCFASFFCFVVCIAVWDLFGIFEYKIRKYGSIYELVVWRVTSLCFNIRRTGREGIEPYRTMHDSALFGSWNSNYHQFFVIKGKYAFDSVPDK